MSAEDLDNPISYEQLEDIEDDFEDVELELLRMQDKMSKELYAKREKVVKSIPSFWPLVFEQAPPDIDEYIQPTDSAVLLSSLVGLSVERFELPGGDPRSISIKWEFSENEYFENKTLEKKFWWRYAKDGWAGLVSEPVEIKWKEGKDLTSGMLGLVQKVYEEEKAGKGTGEGAEETEAQKKLKEQMDSTGLGGLSFFAWFGFRGRKVTDEESKEAFKEEQEKRKARKEGKEVDVMDEDKEDEDDDEDDEYEMEIFPTADDLAVCIAEDLWPGAIKYFISAQEQDALSDIDFESDEEMEDEDEDEEKHKDKKRKA